MTSSTKVGNPIPRNPGQETCRPRNVQTHHYRLKHIVRTIKTERVRFPATTAIRHGSDGQEGTLAPRAANIKRGGIPLSEHLLSPLTPPPPLRSFFSFEVSFPIQFPSLFRCVLHGRREALDLRACPSFCLFACSVRADEVLGAFRADRSSVSALKGFALILLP